jgi:hypothetical protein
MQAGGGRGNGDLACAVGVNGLVAFEIAGALGIGAWVADITGVAFDIRRQRHFSEAVGDGDDRFVVAGGESDEGGAVVVLGYNFTGEITARMGEGGAHREFFAGFDQTAPDAAAIGGTEQKALYVAAGGALGVKPGGQNGGVVAKEHVAASQELRQIGECVMRERAVGAIHDQQARSITTCGGRLGDEMRGERIVEKIGGEWWHGRKALI